MSDELFFTIHTDIRFTPCPGFDAPENLLLITFDMDLLAAVRLEARIREDSGKSRQAAPIDPPPPLESAGRSIVPRNQVAICIDRNGQLYELFNGDNVLDKAIICDLNADGIVERFDQYNWRVDDKVVSSIEVWTITNPSRCLLRIIDTYSATNKGVASLDFSVGGTDGNAMMITITPLKFAGATSPSHSSAVFIWNANLKRYEGPCGGIDEFWFCPPAEEWSVDNWGEALRAFLRNQPHN